MKYNAKQHWENVFETKNLDEVSWYQINPKTSIDLISSTNPNKDAEIIDVGGGDSNLIDKLIGLEFKNVSVLDVSSKALEKSKQRLGEKAKIVKWIETDLREFKTKDRYDVWHDRAVFHFLTSEKDINRYVELVKKFLKPKGYLIISTFSLEGPEKCSGLNVKRYSNDSIKKIFNEFKHIKSSEEIHHTPFQTTQSFIWNVFKKRDN